MKKIYLRLLILLSIILFLILFLIIFVNHHHNSAQNDIFEASQNNDNYISTTTEKGRKIIDSATGFNFLLPKDWKLETIKNSMTIMAFSSSTYIEENPELKCRIIFQSSKIPSGKHYKLEDLKKTVQRKITENYPRAYNIIFNPMTVNHCPALQTSFEFKNADSFHKFLIIDILDDNNLFDFSGIFLNLKNKNQETICRNGMNRAIQSITLE